MIAIFMATSMLKNQYDRIQRESGKNPNFFAELQNVKTKGDVERLLNTKYSSENSAFATVQRFKNAIEKFGTNFEKAGIKAVESAITTNRQARTPFSGTHNLKTPIPKQTVQTFGTNIGTRNYMGGQLTTYRLDIQPKTPTNNLVVIESAINRQNFDFFDSTKSYAVQITVNGLKGSTIRLTQYPNLQTFLAAIQTAVRDVSDLVIQSGYDIDEIVIDFLEA